MAMLIVEEPTWKGISYKLCRRLGACFSASLMKPWRAQKLQRQGPFDTQAPQNIACVASSLHDLCGQSEKWAVEDNIAVPSSRAESH